MSLDLDSVALLGAALGGAVALVPASGPVPRVVGFLAGFTVAWVGYAARAALLPDTDTGRAAAVFGVLALCTVVAVASLRRLPMWALLVGAAAMVGAYEESYSASPSQFLSSSPSAATPVLLAAAFGFVAAALLGDRVPGGSEGRTDVDGGAHADHRNDDESVVA